MESVSQVLKKLMKNTPISDDGAKNDGNDEMVKCLYCGKMHKSCRYDEDGEYLFKGLCSIQCQKFARRRQSMANYFKACNVPPRYANSSFKNFKIDDKNKLAYDYLSNLQKLEGSIFITGPVGCGKTHLAVALMRNLATKQIEKFLFKSATDILLNLKSAFSNNEVSEEEVYKKFKGKDILIIDDIGTEKLTDYVIQSWYSIVDYRYSHCLPTVYTSNLDIKDVAIRFGDRVASRLASEKILSVCGDDRRVIKK